MSTILIAMLTTPLLLTQEAPPTAGDLVRTMMDPARPWAERVRAEVALEKAPSPAVLAALLPHVSTPMPPGGIWNSGGREGDARAPVAWQVYHAAGRVWFQHTYGPGRAAVVGATLVELLDRARGRSRLEVVAAMHRCWGPGLEEPLLALLRGAATPPDLRLAAAQVLCHRRAEACVPVLRARSEATPLSAADPWLELLLEHRVKAATGVLRPVVTRARQRIAARKVRAPMEAYMLAVRLEAYLGARFRPLPHELAPPDPAFFAKTVENALAAGR